MRIETKVTHNHRGIVIHVCWEYAGIHYRVIVDGMPPDRDNPPRVNISATGDMPTRCVEVFNKAVELAKDFAEGKDTHEAEHALVYTIIHEEDGEEG